MSNLNIQIPPSWSNSPIYATRLDHSQSKYAQCDATLQEQTRTHVSAYFNRCGLGQQGWKSAALRKPSRNLIVILPFNIVQVVSMLDFVAYMFLSIPMIRATRALCLWLPYPTGTGSLSTRMDAIYRRPLLT